MAQAIRTPRTPGRNGAIGQQTHRSDLLHLRQFRGRHHAAAILVVLALAVVGFRLFPGRDVTVVQDGQSYHLSATFNPEEEALAAVADPAQRTVRKVALEGENGYVVWSVKTTLKDPRGGPDPKLEAKVDAGGEGRVLSIECDPDDD